MSCVDVTNASRTRRLKRKAAARSPRKRTFMVRAQAAQTSTHTMSRQAKSQKIWRSAKRSVLAARARLSAERAAMHRVALRGMTLIEVLIAMVIISMITTMIYGAFVQTRKNKEAVQRVTDRYHEIRMGLERVQMDLSMAYVSAHVPADESRRAWVTQFVGKDSGERDRVDFNTFGHQRLFRDAKETDQNELSYFVADDPDEPGAKVLVRREDNRPDLRPDKGGNYQILIRNIEGFELEYLDPQTKLWTKSWDTTQAAGQPNRLPMQVKVLLTVPDVSDPSKERVFGTRATLPMEWGLNHAAYNP